jgi:hypothetical protein
MRSTMIDVFMSNQKNHLITAAEYARINAVSRARRILYPKDPDFRMPVHSTALPDFSPTLDTHDS